jgi:GxxExxY protein
MGLLVHTQVPVPLAYKEVKLDVGYRLDLLVEDLVVIEVKSVDALAAIHHPQLLSYLKISGKKLGILINFNEVHLRHGIKRVVNGLQNNLLDVRALKARLPKITSPLRRIRVHFPYHAINQAFFHLAHAGPYGHVSSCPIQLSNKC